MPEESIRQFIQKLREHPTLGEVMKKGGVYHHDNAVVIAPTRKPSLIAKQRQGYSMLSPKEREFIKKEAETIAKQRQLRAFITSERGTQFRVEFMRRTQK